MFSGMGGAIGNSAAEDEMRKSFLSDIKNFFGSISYKGQPGNALNPQIT
jgi:hypothetical protein